MRESFDSSFVSSAFFFLSSSLGDSAEGEREKKMKRPLLLRVKKQPYCEGAHTLGQQREKKGKLLNKLEMSEGR